MKRTLMVAALLCTATGLALSQPPAQPAKPADSSNAMPAPSMPPSAEKAAADPRKHKRKHHARKHHRSAPKPAVPTQ